MSAGREVRAGVVALQGSYELHAECLRKLGVRPVLVRVPLELEGLTHLVVPGGESTTIARLAALFGLGPAIARCHEEGRLALFGTCAGAILLGRDEGEPPPRLGLLDVGVERNAYGEQVASFEARLAVASLGRELDAVFIRAPRFVSPGPGVRVLARHDGDPVLVQQGALLASSFHTELAGDPALHAYFLTLSDGGSTEPGTVSSDSRNAAE